MRVNAYLIRVAVVMIIILGGQSAIRCIRTGELPADQAVGAAAGSLLLVGSLIWQAWRKRADNRRA